MSASLPKISVVTPSFNQGRFIEQTIVSVLDQNYPNLEYVVMDGGSTDNTVDTLREYERYLDFWISAPDNGQAHAINQGFARSSGDILTWLNSDDRYEPGALMEVADMFRSSPGVDVISGRCRLWYGDMRDRLMEPSPLRRLEDFLKINTNWRNSRLIVQPEAFFRKQAFVKAGPLREDLHYCFDQNLWMAMAKAGCVFTSVDRHWADLRMHEDQKTWELGKALAELARVAWDETRECWSSLDNPIAIADDIFSAVEALLMHEQNASQNVLQSTSYRVGRFLTKRKFW
ncbi:MAG TPA: glycosyltransferase family 2 protein [Xanthobacteraceae bacterium]|jgi:glycosyltransferase involved in cell wall biosynthesis|nr:glycosyltransferase family 2 protein [Xanthobacteraceae bacterium]